MPQLICSAETGFRALVASWETLHCFEHRSSHRLPWASELAGLILRWKKIGIGSFIASRWATPSRRQLSKAKGPFSEFVVPFDSVIHAFDPHLFYSGNLEKDQASLFIFGHNLVFPQQEETGLMHLIVTFSAFSNKPDFCFPHCGVHVACRQSMPGWDLVNSPELDRFRLGPGWVDSLQGRSGARARVW